MRTRILLAAFALALLPAAAQADTITFDDRPPGVLSAQPYQSRGVQFSSAPPIVGAGFANTAPNYLSTRGPDLFGSHGLVVSFVTPLGERAYTTSFDFFVVGPAAAPYTITPRDHLGNFLTPIDSSELGAHYIFSGALYGGFILTTKQAGIGIDTLTFGPVQVVPRTPEPATLLLLGTGLAGIGAAVRRRRSQARG